MSSRIIFSIILIALLLFVGCQTQAFQEETNLTSLDERADFSNNTDEKGALRTAASPGLIPSFAQTDELEITHGPLSGEVSSTAVTLWARGNITGTLLFEIATTEEFTDTIVAPGIEVSLAGDYIGEVRVEELEPATEYLYRVALTDGEENSSEVVNGRFQTAPEGTAAFDFVFGGDIGGQGLCRNAKDGWTIFETIASKAGDFFLLTGDSVYVDNACETPDNEPGAVGPYTDLTGFRDRYRYHLEDSNYADFLAQTPIYVTWDDHEIINDFGGPALNAINPQLFANGQQAYFDYWPISGTEEDPYQLYRQFSYGGHADFFILDTRSYRDPNVNWDPNPTTLEPKTMLGQAQFEWLQAGLSASQATWKFVVSSVPLSYPTGFPQPQVDGRDSWANYTEKSGYETELAALIFYILNHDIDNVVFIGGDVHWPFALSYDPDRDSQADFYEISAGPISAITLPPVDPPDPSFNPEVLFAAGEFNTDFFNFGQVAVTEEGQLIFHILDQNGETLFTLSLDPLLPAPEAEEEAE